MRKTSGKSLKRKESHASNHISTERPRTWTRTASFLQRDRACHPLFDELQESGCLTVYLFDHRNPLTTGCAAHDPPSDRRGHKRLCRKSGFGWVGEDPGKLYERGVAEDSRSYRQGCILNIGSAQGSVGSGYQ